MRCEVLAVGTELLLGQIIDTNSSWIGERLAAHGIDSHFQTKVGDNLERIVDALALALDRSDAVVVCGGLGPTHDDITRLAVAQVMGAELVRNEEVLDRIRSMFEARGRTMPPSNAAQADVPVGATVIEQRRGTAPGLICPVDDKVIYVVPGVPHEMIEMMERVVLGDLVERSGTKSVIVSRVLRTWGESESGLADLLSDHIASLDHPSAKCTLAFLASGIEGIKVRITAKGADLAESQATLGREEQVLRSLLGDLVFGVDAQTMESAVGDKLVERGWSLGLAESMTGGLVAMRMTAVPGASEWFRGGVVSYASSIKFDLLGVGQGPVVSERCAAEMATGVRKVLGADVGLSVTGVAGPSEQDGEPVGTIWLGCDLSGEVHTRLVRASHMGGREQIRQIAAISLSDFLRRLLG